VLSTGDKPVRKFNVFRCGLGSSLDVHKFRSSSSVRSWRKLLLFVFFEIHKVLTLLRGGVTNI